MTDKGRVHAPFAVELFFERENNEGLVDVIAEEAYSSLSPRPELRGDVVDRWDAAAFHLAGYAPVESGRVDNDGEIRLAPVSFANQVLVESQNFGQVAENLGDTDDRQVFGIDDGVASGYAHTVTANAEELERWIEVLQGLDELRTVHFTGSFAGGDQDKHESLATGLSSRWVRTG